MGIAEFIEQNHDELLARWEEEVRREVPSARDLESLALRDHLPHIMQDILQALGELGGSEQTRVATKGGAADTHSVQHGRHRASTDGYSTDQILHEYLILRYIIADSVFEANLWDHHSVEAITRVLERGSISAVSAFVKSMEEVQQRLLGTLAHDIRTPLSTARTAMTLLKDEAKDSDSSDELKEMALHGVDRALEMLGGLLDSIVAEAGDGIMLTFEEADFAQEILSACKEARRIYASDVVDYCPDEPLSGIFDPAALRRIFENLMSNAVRHGERSSPVRVRLQSKGDHVSLSVNNRGKPIPEDRREEIFEFLSSTNEDESGGPFGWGIGLSYVKLAVEGHKGRVWVESDPSEGTTFFVEIPRFACRPGKVRTRLMR